MESQSTTESVEVLEGNVSLIEYGEREGERPQYFEYPEFRKFCTKIPCVVCQWVTRRKEDEARLSYVPELVRVSDPHHLKTRGSGGPDAENLVPLCPKHHSEWGTIGGLQFQIKYNVNLKAIAIEMYEVFLNSINLQEIPQLVFAHHQKLLSHLDEVRQATAMCADEILVFLEEDFTGKPAYQWLGFRTFSAYATASVARGGLGLKERTAYRLLAMARVKSLLDGDEKLTKDLGTYKAEILLPVLKTIETTEERKEIAQAIASMSLADSIKWKNDKTGAIDRRQTIQEAIADACYEFLSPKGFNDRDEIERLSWIIMRALDILKQRS